MAVVQEIARQVEQGLANELGAEWTTDALVVQQVRNSMTMAYPDSSVSVLLSDECNAEKLEIAEMTWGFPVEWSKQLVYNTRIETALGRDSMWRESIEQRRCVIPVLAFYETHATETVRSAKTGRPIKRKYRFSLEKGLDRVFFLAGIYDRARFSVVTTQPNASVAPVHDRMPLLLQAQDVSAWLGNGYASLAKPSSLPLVAEAAEESGEVQLSLF